MERQNKPSAYYRSHLRKQVGFFCYNLCKIKIENYLNCVSDSTQINCYLQGMTLNFQHTFAILSVVILTHLTTATFACTCIGKDKQTTENELNFADLAVKGKIIAVTNFDYYDTTSYSVAGLKFDPKQSGYLIRKYKVFSLAVDTKFKAGKITSDTVQIVTGYGGGDCGYEFEIGKDYIVFAEAWKEKTITLRHKKRKIKRKLTEITIANKFYTDICRLTQDSNEKELTNLKRLTE